MYRPGDPWPGIFDRLPSELAGCLTEPAFDTRHSTFCLWRQVRDDEWHRGAVAFPPGEDPDGSADLLQLLDGRADSYQTFAENYFETKIPLAAIEAIYRHEPLHRELLGQLNSAVDPDSLEEDVEEIGYPERRRRRSAAR